MCGIAGKLCGTGAVDRELVERMCEVLEHRGPDSRGTYLEDGVGLGIQRLRVIDVETGDQPLYNEDRSVVVVLNGEIYNYRELRAGLVERGHRLSTKSDTEVIAHLYEEEGADCVHALRGMFAFALWDRNERKLLLVRDRLGKKPLVYAHDARSLWFASEAKAILQDPEIRRRPDFDAIDCYLQYQYVPHPLTAFEGISKLPPAHLLVWQDGKIETRRYWQLSYEPQRGITEPEAREEILSRLLESTRLRLRSDVPLGAFLSGGVDSSAVVAAMAMESPNPIRTFSIGFDVESFDETEHARTVAKLFGTDHEELRIHPDAMEVLPRLVWHYGEPFADHSAIPSFYLAELTRSSVTVALNGDGGDENFAGYSRYAANAVVEHLGRLPGPIKRGLLQVGCMLGEPRGESGFVARVQRLTKAATLDHCDRYPTWVSFFTQLERDALYTADFRESLPPRSAPSIIREPCLASGARDPVNRLLDIDVQTYLPGDLLVKMDIASMAHSLEVRSPLLDHTFMEFAAGLPGKWKLSGGRTKGIFKDALAAWLPRDLLERKKQGFGVPIGHWLSNELRDLPREILLDPIARSRGFFREEGIRRLIDDHVAGRRDNSNKIWALLQLELWFRNFIDREAVGPLALDVVQNGRRVAGVPA